MRINNIQSTQPNFNARWINITEVPEKHVDRLIDNTFIKLKDISTAESMPWNNDGKIMKFLESLLGLDRPYYEGTRITLKDGTPFEFNNLSFDTFTKGLKTASDSPKNSVTTIFTD